MTKPIPKMDEYWIARIKYWPGGESKVDVILIFYVWNNGEIDFIPFQSADGDPFVPHAVNSLNYLRKLR